MSNDPRVELVTSIAHHVFLLGEHHQVNPHMQRSRSILRQMRGRPRKRKEIMLRDALGKQLGDDTRFKPIERWYDIVETVSLLAPLQASLRHEPQDQNYQNKHHNFGMTVAASLGNEEGSAVWRRMFVLLDCDREFLERPLYALLRMCRDQAAHPINWPQLYKDVLFWHYTTKGRYLSRDNWAGGFCAYSPKDQNEDTSDEVTQGA